MTTPTRTARLPHFVAILFLGSGLLYSWFYLLCEDCGADLEMERPASEIAESFSSPLPTPQTNEPTERPALAPTELQKRQKELLGYRFEAYATALDNLDLNFQIQGILIIASLVVIVRGRHLKIPFTEIEVPARYLHVIIPGILLYFWLRFGYQVNLLIESRRAGVQLLTALGDPLNEQWMSALFRFNDGGFMDAWFSHCTADDPVRNNHPIITSIFFSLIFGTFLGAGHSCIITLPHLGNHRHKHSTKKLEYLARLLPWVAMIVLLASHYAFADYDADHRCWIMPVIGVFAVFFTYLFSWLGLRVPVSPETEPDPPSQEGSPENPPAKT